jgi:O-antigen/teichoic acid export membrane protein
VLALLTSRATADSVAPVLAVLALAFLGNAVVSLAYTAAIASGNTSIPVRINLVGVAVYLPLLLVLTIAVGPLGAAVAWLLLNLYYIPSLLPPVHRRVIAVPLLGWFRRCLVPFLGCGIACFGAGKLVVILVGGSIAGLPYVVAVACCLAYAAVAFLALNRQLRLEMLRSLGQVRLAFANATSAPPR